MTEMVLHITATSPYARIARIVVREKGLEDRVEEMLARTRTVGSPYYEVNPSGRVPCLILPDGRVMEDSVLICDFLDHLDGAPAFARPMGADRWDFAMAEARARSLLDGLSVLVRERYRPEDERSPTIIAHEIARARRMLTLWEKEFEAPPLIGPLNYVQMVMACVGEAVGRVPEFDPPAEWPCLMAWTAEMTRRPSLAATLPPGR